MKGRKISGNAQTIKKNVVLQHGTILLKYDAELMYSILKVKYAGKKEKVVSSVYQKVTAIEQESKTEYDYEKVRIALIKGYEKALNVKFKQDRLTEAETKMMEQLINNKYKTDDWNFKL